jgi:flotillin
MGLGFLIVAAVVVALVFLLLLAFKSMYKVAEPNEALIVSGFGAYRQNDNPAEASTLGFKIVVGKGVFVFPLVQSVRRLSLALHKAELIVDCVTTQGIPVHVRGVVVYKVGDDFAEIANAARRFLDKENEMDANVHEVFAGHLRQIVGSLTVEDMIRAREKLAAETRASSAVEMEKLGLVIDSLQIQQVEDPTGYIENLAKPFQAAVAADARIAAAERDREATEKEQEANAQKAKAVSTSAVEQARLQAEADRAKAVAAQAGPLSDAEARKAVVVQETEVAQLEAQRTEQRLQTEIVKPAQAERDARVASAEAARQEVELRAAAEAARVRTEAAAAAEQRKLLAEAEGFATERTGEADAKATRLRGEAEGSAINAKLTAEAEGIQKRADALRENQEAVINQSIAEQLPQIVEAAAGAYKGVDHMVVLNGAEGMGNITGQVLGTGLSVIPMIREAFQSGLNGGRGSENGEPKRAVKPPAKQPEAEQ